MALNPPPVNVSPSTDGSSYQRYFNYFYNQLNNITGNFAPNAATYILQTPDVNLPQAQALSSLGAGFLLNNASGKLMNIGTTIGSSYLTATGVIATSYGSSSIVPVIVVNTQGQITSVTNVTITPSAIGAPSGSGTSTGSNTGDQTITLTGGVTGSGSGSFAATVVTNANLTGVVTSSGNATVFATMTSNSVLLGNGTATPQQVAPGTSGNVLTSNGTTWQSTAPTVSTSVNQNIVIGGDFSLNPWQQGTSFAAANGQNADMFYYQAVGTAVATVSKVADVPTATQAGTLTNHCYSVAITTAESTIISTDLYRIIYEIEGYDFSKIAQQAFTISFWVKSTITGIYGISFADVAGDRAYIAQYTINTTNTWQKITITVPASPSAGTWAYDTGVGLIISFGLAMGSNWYSSTIGSWFTPSGNLWLGSSNQVNAMSSTSNIFKLALIKIEVGSSATGWQQESAGEVLRQCQRYYEKTYSQGTTPATNTAISSFNNSDSAAVTGALDFSESFKVTKRTAPTITLYSVAGTSGKVTQSDATEITASATNIGDSQFRITATNASTKAGAAGHWVANARLI